MECKTRYDLEQMLVDETADPMALPLSLLEDITGGFSDAQEIGRGGFARVYKGILGDRAVAVKRLSNAFMDETEFHREIICLMQVKHKNVVRFLGYCADRQGSLTSYDGKLVMADVHQRLICFEYISNGTLDKYIIDAHREWGMCYKIIKGICEGLQYLHENHIVHLDLKPANILLDENMIPKITDFGLARCFDKDQSQYITKNILGTMGYLAPEYLDGGVIARSVDLYSLGVIMFEILTGQKGHQSSEDVLVGWSDRLESSQHRTLCEEIRVCYNIALECRDFNPKKRPASVRIIIDRLYAMESMMMAKAASSTSGVAATESKGKKGNSDDASTNHPLGVGVQTVLMPDAASTNPRRAMAAPAPPPKHTVVMPRPAPTYGLVETNPRIPAKMSLQRAAAKMYDMVEPMTFLYVSVVKARDLPTMDITGSLDPYVQVKMGNFVGVTRHVEKNAQPVWRQTFAFSGAHLQSSKLEVILKDKGMLSCDDFVGRVVFDMSDVPSRVPPDSPLAPLWYRLAGSGKIMLAVWLGTQADEAFPEAWSSDAHSLSKEALANTRSKAYLSPKLTYLKVSVIAAQDLIAADKGRPLAATIIQVQMGNQIRRTRPQGGTANPVWAEEFMFVAAEPYEDPLVVTVVEEVAAGMDDPIGRVIIPVNSPYVPRNDLADFVPSKWFSLSRSRMTTVEEAAAHATTSMKFASKIHLKLSLETAYHVLDEFMHYSSDLQPAAKERRKSAIGILEVGILSARGLSGNKNPYAVAKYGAKWVRTRTLMATVAPVWNEQYSWQVFDLSTVVTIAVFNNATLHNLHGDGASMDQRIGKVRVRLTTLDSDRVYTHYYPLISLSPSGLKKTGELHLAVRFTCTSWTDMLAQYGRPLLPEVHYTNPISVLQLEYLQLRAMEMVVTRLGRAEPPLRREVVEYMLDVDSNMFSLRRSKANFLRLTSLFSGVVAVADGICKWKNPPATTLVHVMFVYIVCYPELVLPMVFLCMIMIGAWNYLQRPQAPPYIDPVLSQAEKFDALPPPNEDSVLDSLLSVLGYADEALLDELDEEFDTYPTSMSNDIVGMRYDRLRSNAGRLQTVVGDLATQGERALSLVRWHDPRLTPVFIMLSLVVAIVLYLTPFRVVALVMGLYFLRPPWFRSRTSLLFNLYARLPSNNDVML